MSTPQPTTDALDLSPIKARLAATTGQQWVGIHDPSRPQDGGFLHATRQGAEVNLLQIVEVKTQHASGERKREEARFTNVEE
jgi:hypothetical protein